MKSKLVMAAAATMLISGCASTQIPDEQKLALYRSHAGQPVDKFSFYGSINGWTPLGDSALAVWTRPGQAWLLDLKGPCPDLEFTQAIGLTSSMNQVSANFDKVLVRNNGAIPAMPCFIDTIRPLDVKALREDEKNLRKADTVDQASGT